jgi:predicted dehydrogenase
MFFDEDHKENIIQSEEGVSHAYVGHAMETGFLTSNASGNWALGNYWGPLGEETRSWLDHLSTGAPSPHTTAEEARINLQVTTAIEQAAASGETVRLTFGGDNVG